MAAGDQTLSQALLLITKVSNNQNKRLDKLEKMVGTSSAPGAPKGEKVEELVKKAEPRIITDFGKAAEKDLKSALTQTDDDKGQKPGGGMDGLKKILGPALLVLGGLAALVQGLMTDGPLKGFLKILAKGGIIGGIKLFQKQIGKQIGNFTKAFAKILPKGLFDNVITSAKGFLKNVTNFLLGPFKKLAGKGGGKALFGTIFGLFSKFLKPVLKRIPGIGSLISWGFAISRFKSGDLVGGLIDVASGIATLFPGIGTGISIGLDVLNAFLDVKKGKDDKVKAEGAPGGIGVFFGKIKDTIMNNFPIKNLVSFYSGVGKVLTGNFKEGFHQMAFALPFMGPLADFLFGEKNEEGEREGGAALSFKNFFSGIKNKIIGTLLGMIPKKILGVSVRSRVGKLLGFDAGEINDDPDAGPDHGKDIKQNNNSGRRRREDGGPVTQGTEYIVGEAGPEIFVPETDGFIVSNDKSLNLLDRETFNKTSNNTLKLNNEQLFELKKQNMLLKALLEKNNTGGNIINTNNTNTSIINSNKGPSIKQFRELYA